MKRTLRQTSRVFVPALSLALCAPPLFAQAPSVHVQPPALGGSRAVEPQTQAAVLRDYLDSWVSMKAAFAQNRPEMLDPDFVGTAREKLGATVVQQSAQGVTTQFTDESHDVQFVFYSPQGSSLELIDTVVGQQRVMLNGKVLASQPTTNRYIVVMTPSNRWQVRIFQAEAGR